jgi:hypothetical protein
MSHPDRSAVGRAATGWQQRLGFLLVRRFIGSLVLWKGESGGATQGGPRLPICKPIGRSAILVDARDGKILNTVGVLSPRGVGAGGGRIYLLSGTRLLELHYDGSSARTIIESSLDDPSGLALDQAPLISLSRLSYAGLGVMSARISPAGASCQAW